MTLTTVSLVLIPTFFYLLIILFTTPVSSIKISTSLKYLFYGCASVLLVDIFQEKLPDFFKPYSSDIVLISKDIDSIIYLCFLQIGFVEEFCKFLTFVFIYNFLTLDKNYHPIGTMFYYGMVGLSFGTLENLHYAKLFGDEVILPRSVTAMLLHMLLGFISGYWMALINIKPKKGRSLLELMMYKNRIFKIIFYSVSAVFVPTIIHAIYNFNLFTSRSSSWSIMFTQLFLTMFITYIASKDILKKYKKSFKSIK